MPDEKPLDGPEGPTHDFTDLHAWCEVYLPGAGWVGLDPTSGLLTGEGHIPLACTPEPSAPRRSTGAVDESEVTFDHDMKVTRVRETPRVTKPYSDEQWAGYRRVGEAMDGDLGKHDLRLTMGGEPTFVSIDDMDGEEWNTAALGAGASGARRAMLFRKLARPLRLGSAAAFRPGQMVPRRAAAALGAQLPLAQGRRGDLARPAPLCPGVQADRRHAGDGASLRARLRAAPATRSRLPVRRVRGHLVLPVARTPLAQQRHGRRSQGEGSAGARAPGTRLREGA